MVAVEGRTATNDGEDLMADSAKEFPKDAASQLQDLVPTATAVLSDPNTFFAAMPKQGGLEAPGAFALAMLVAEGAILAVLSLLTFQVGGVFASLIGVPILGAIGLLIGAAIVLFVSGALGGEATFESSFRIVAYSAVIAPIQAVAHIVPYLSILVSAYGFYLVIIAVIRVHGVPEQKAWRVLGAVAAVLLLLSLLTTMSARRMASKIETMQPELEDFSRKMQHQAEEMQKSAEKMQREIERQKQRQEKSDE
jgi:hypothetical protein